MVKLVDESGCNLVKTSEALEKAKDQGLDLVVVSDKDTPTVKIMDYGKYKFDLDKKMKEQKRKHQIVKTKEIKLRPKIHPHDQDVKVNQGIKFLKKGHKLKVTIMFSGRDSRELGWEIINKVQESIVPDFGTVESKPLMDGRNLFMLLSPK